MIFGTLVDANPQKTRIIGKEEHVSTKLVNGMRGVMNEGGLEGWKMQKAHASEC
jgi:hypothetical protein